MYLDPQTKYPVSGKDIARFSGRYSRSLGQDSVEEYTTGKLAVAIIERVGEIKINLGFVDFKLEMFVPDVVEEFLKPMIENKVNEFFKEKDDLRNPTKVGEALYGLADYFLDEIKKYAGDEIGSGSTYEIDHFWDGVDIINIFETEVQDRIANTFKAYVDAVVENPLLLIYVAVTGAANAPLDNNLINNILGIFLSFVGIDNVIAEPRASLREVIYNFMLGIVNEVADAVGALTREEIDIARAEGREKELLTWREGARVKANEIFASLPPISEALRDLVLGRVSTDPPLSDSEIFMDFWRPIHAQMYNWLATYFPFDINSSIVKRFSFDPTRYEMMNYLMTKILGKIKESEEAPPPIADIEWQIMEPEMPGDLEREEVKEWDAVRMEPALPIGKIVIGAGLLLLALKFLKK